MTSGPRDTAGTTSELGLRREFVLTPADFEFIRKLTLEHTGINLSEGKREMVYGRLARRLRELQLESFGDYCRVLERDDGELMNLVNAITTNLTSFFRENHHFEYLRDTVLPDLFEQNQAARKIRIWSAGCSTGEEPYSIAMTMRECAPAGWDIRILATDIDTNVLARAANGVYPLAATKNIPPQRLQRWFHKGKGSNQGTVRVSDELRGMIAFKRLNLIDPWPMKGPFDVIFCRNVVIYFDKPTQKRLFDRYADMLGSRRCLFVGHSESLFQVCDRFELLGQTVYVKKR